MGLEDFHYDAMHSVVVCRPCKTCLIPGHRAGRREAPWENHLRGEPHRLQGEALQSSMAFLASLRLEDADGLRARAEGGKAPSSRIEALPALDGYLCTTCDEEGRLFATTRLKAVKNHQPSAHDGRSASDHRRDGGPALWRAVRLQSYSTARNRIIYFVVQEEEEERGEGEEEEEEEEEEEKELVRAAAACSSQPWPRQEREQEEQEKQQGRLLLLTEPDSALVAQLSERLTQASQEVERRATVVEGPAGSGRDRRSEERWLIRTGFPAHLRGLPDERIVASYRLPRPAAATATRAGAGGRGRGGGRGGGGGGGEGSSGSSREERDLGRILCAAESFFRDAYALVSDQSPGHRMTQQRAQVLSNFAAGVGNKGKDTAFRAFKHGSTLTTYFQRMKELLVYYYRVVHREGGHFRPRRPLNGGQEEAEEEAEEAVEEEAEEEEEEEEEEGGPSWPEDVVRPTDQQRRAMEEMFAVLRGREGGLLRQEAEEARALRPALRRFYMHLICQTVGSEPFRSPLLSFCAMISRTGARRGGSRPGAAAAAKGTGNDEQDEAARQLSMRRGWHEPGNYTSSLSALVWMAQLVIFESVCHREDCESRSSSSSSSSSGGGGGGGSSVLEKLQTVCESFMHQAGETPFGYILQWRLYLGAVAKQAITGRQARWSVDGTEITYLGQALHIYKHVPQLILHEYKRARGLLHQSLLFGSRATLPIQAHEVCDDLDDEASGGSWATDPGNGPLLQGADMALLREVSGRPELRNLFFIHAGEEEEEGEDEEASSSAVAGSKRKRGRGRVGKRAGKEGKKTLCRRAVALYEASVQDFLGACVAPLHASPGPPLRAPEFLSMTFANTGQRRRSLFVWGRMLMLHVRYHKLQEQVDQAQDNIRFVPNAIAELLLTFLAYVQPFRLMLQQEEGRPVRLLSPYLFSRADGTVWADEMLSRSLGQACARAKVPKIGVAWWRQAAASIVKVKFNALERANFNVGDAKAAEVVEEEEVMADLAGLSNHTFRTANQAYAGSTTLAVDTALHRAYRASASWRGLFGIDSLLAHEKAAQATAADRPPAQLSAGSSGSKAQGRDRGRAMDREEEEEAPHAVYAVQAVEKARVRARPTEVEQGLEAAAQRLYKDPQLRLRRPGQRDAMLAALGPGAAEQVVAVLATGSGKSLLFMVAPMLRGAATTVVIVPTVALQGNLLARASSCGIRTMTWSPGEKRSAPLVLAAAESACTPAFLEWALLLDVKRRLDRIVVEECHLTVTAASFRRSMRTLGSFVRQVPTQTVWLTATLPPALEPEFLERNMLVRPRIVRESTNRPNIRYRVHRYGGKQGRGHRHRRAGGLCEEVVALVQSYEPAAPRARFIVYSATTDLMQELAAALRCGMYTGQQDIMTRADREAALEAWLCPSGSPVIVATSALGVGFDYPHVRCVIHAGPPRQMTDFAQESGRAGRDGRPAESIVVLSASWRPGSEGGEPALDADKEFMQLYLTQQHCLRAVISQYLDERRDWRWCMEGEDELCAACPRHHAERRPVSLELALGPPPVSRGQRQQQQQAGQSPAAMAYTGPSAVLQQRMLDEEAVARFRKDLEAMSGCCLLCRVKGQGKIPFDHPADQCSRRFSWLNAKKETLRKHGRRWMAPFSACFHCYLPQAICPRADPESGASSCLFPDLAFPLCYAAFYAVGPRGLIRQHAARPFQDEADYMTWLGQASTLAGEPCTQMARVAMLLLATLA